MVAAGALDTGSNAKEKNPAYCCSLQEIQYFLRWQHFGHETFVRNLKKLFAFTKETFLCFMEIYGIGKVMEI